MPNANPAEQFRPADVPAFGVVGLFLGGAAEPLHRERDGLADELVRLVREVRRPAAQFQYPGVHGHSV